MRSLQYVLVLLLAAWVMGAVFDIYNTVTGASKWLRWLRPMLDVCFWTGSAAFVFYLTYLTDDGRWRLYTIVLLVAGYVMYRWLAHQQVVGSAFAVVRVIAGVLRAAYAVFATVVLRPVRLLQRLLVAVFRRLYRLMCWLEDGLFWLLRFWGRLLTWPLARPWRQTSPVRERISRQWEGLWDAASKWLRRAFERR